MNFDITHFVKCWPQFFDAFLLEQKPFDIRRADRGYMEGHLIRQREYEWRTDSPFYTGRELTLRITYIAPAIPGLPDNYVAMTVEWGFWKDLVAIYGKDAHHWMELAHAGLEESDGRFLSPRVAIRSGQYDRVAKIVDQLASSAYA